MFLFFLSALLSKWVWTTLPFRTFLRVRQILLFYKRTLQWEIKRILDNAIVYPEVGRSEVWVWPV